MPSRVPLPDIGRVVEVIRGRDSGLLAVVIGHEPTRFVWIADGDKRRAEHPKKKNVLHLRNTGLVFEEVAADIREHGRVTNARLRHTVKRAQTTHGVSHDETREGGMPHGQG